MSFIHDYHQRNDLKNAAEHTAEADVDEHAISLYPPAIQLKANSVIQANTEGNDLGPGEEDQNQSKNLCHENS